ncbi:MAG: Hsp33 family molecular chaperone HslO [Christensenellales bacterium]|jgi:molecular chaperone Hsp33
MDKLIKGLMADSAMNFYAINAPALVEQARLTHNTSPVCTAALGRALMGASIMGAMLKVPQAEVSLIFKGGGPAGNIVCVGRQDASVKGLIGNPAVDLPPAEDGKLAVGEAVGKDGTLTVITDLRLKEAYTGQSALISGEIAEDIAAYFANSQQQPTAVFLGVHMNSEGITAACGLLVQAMPGCPEDVLEKVEKRMYAAQEMPALISEAGMSLEQIIDWLFSDLSPNILETVEPRLLCDCNRDRLERALLGLGEEELLKMASEQKGASLICHFCNAEYNFTKEELTAIAAVANAAQAERKDAHD